MKCVATLITLLSVFHLGEALNSWELPDHADLLSYINSDLDMEWLGFKKSYNRTHSSQKEELERRIYWEDTIKFIQDHNLRYDRGEETYTVGENDFADMAEDEFQRIYLSGLVIPAEVELGLEEDVEEEVADLDEGPALEALDWRLRNKVSPVKYQGSCGSCWAFSAIGALESAVKIKTGKDVNLSEQELVDCANRRYGNDGCRGGWMNNAFTYIERAGGVDTEECYRYRGTLQGCAHKSSCVGARMSGHRDTRKWSESSLAQALSTKGPVAVAADVSDRGFMSYRQGVFDTPYCDKRRPNHAMLNVGYARSSRGGNYWIIKNSWGTTWGDQGYVFMAKDKGDTCGLAGFASYPVLK